MIVQTTNLWFYLVLAALAGSLLGWIFRGSCKKRLQLVEEQFKERYSRLKENCQQYKQKLIRLNKKSAEQSASLEECRSLIIKVEQENKKITPLKKQLVESKEAVNKIRSYAQNQQKNLLHYKKMMRQAKQVIEQHKQEIEQLILQVSANEKRAADLQKAYDSTQHLLSQGQATAMSSQLKIAELTTHITTYKKQLSEAQAMLNTQKEGFAKVVTSTVDDKERATEPLDDFVATPEESQRQENLQIQLKQNEQVVAEQKSEIEALQKLIQQGIDDKQAVVKEFDDFKRESQLYVSTAMDDTRRYRQGVEFLQSELDKCQQELSAISDTKDEVKVESVAETLIKNSEQSLDSVSHEAELSHKKVMRRQRLGKLLRRKRRR